MAIKELLADMQLPKMLRIRQRFSGERVEDVEKTLRTKLRDAAVAERIQPGMRVAVGVGSRGIADVAVLVKTVVDELRQWGARPFIVPAMGSHGGATAEGQAELLAGLGVDEARMNCPVHSAMDVVQLGTLANGLPVYIDQNAAAADGIVIINRVKPHTGFSGNHESGLAKMITVGLGKQKGAAACHKGGRTEMSRNIAAAAQLALQKAPFLFAVGTVENAYDKIARLEVVLPDRLIDTDAQLLIEAKARMPKIFLQPIDVLIVDKMGKEYSGAGMDPHVTGRASWPAVKVGPEPGRIVVLDLSEYSHGNAVGMGVADVITRRFFNKLNFEACYTNALTARGTQGVRIPMIMESDQLAIQAGMRTCYTTDVAKMRIVRIANTLSLGEIYISECMYREARQHPDISILTEAAEVVFDEKGNLAS
jgi:Uncharacterized conserved protein